MQRVLRAASGGGAGRLLHKMNPESRLGVQWCAARSIVACESLCCPADDATCRAESWGCRIFFIFGFAVVFPTYMYSSIVQPLSVRHEFLSENARARS
jgi:hypothetical protein